VLHNVSRSRSGRRSGRLTAIVAAATAAAIALAGCTSARDVSSSPAATPVAGGTLTVAVALDALPSGIFATLDRNFPWIENVFEPLVRLDPETRELEPVLATDVEVASDGMSAVVTLREGVTFQNGAPFNADTAKFSIEKSIDPTAGNNLAFVGRAFEEISVDSDTQLTIRFAKELGDSFLDYLTQTEMVDPTSYDGIADGSQVVGTGPFAFGDWRPGAGFTLTKFADYWDVDKVYLDEIDYVVTGDATAEINAVKSGRADIGYGMAPANAITFDGDDRFRFVEGTLSIYPIGLNVQAGPFTEQAVRQAVGYAIDYDRLNDQVFAGFGTVTNLPWTPGSVDESREKHYTYDPEKAKQLVADAGAEGAQVKITYNRSNATVNAEYQIIANNLTEIGLVPVADGLDQPTYQAAQTNATIEQSFLTLHGQTGLAPATVVQGVPTLRAGNASHMDTPEYQELSAALVAATTPDETQDALDALSDYMLDQAFLLTMVQSPNVIVVSNSVNGVETTIRGLLLFKKAYVSE
jgi:peptide/nickel transport system substrate-binding protein